MGWKIVAELRWGGELRLQLSSTTAVAYRSVPYYDEFTEQRMFKAVARGHTDPRAYCMGCGMEEGALHENWCHAVKEAHRKKAAPSVGEQIRQALAERDGRKPETAPTVNMDEVLARRAVNHRAFDNEYHWSWITCIGGVWRDADYGFKEATCPDCKGTVVAPERPRAKKARSDGVIGVDFHMGEPIIAVTKQPPPKTHPTGVNWVGTEVKSWWFWCAKNGLTTTSSANIGEARCLACGVMVQTPGVNFLHAWASRSWLPGKETGQPSAVSQAKAFHLRPPRREIVVLVDDQSEPP